MPSLTQRSFAGGEVAPAVFGRADQVKYQTGLRTCRNFIIRRQGGASNRSGTKYIREQKSSSAKGRQLKFVFNADQTYVLIFENLSMRITRNGAPITVSGVAAYSGATAYVIGDLVASGGVNYYCIAGTTGNAPPNTTYWYALTGTIYEIPTPYVTADLPTLQYVQSGDVITITHPNYQVRDLARTGHTTWTLTVVTLAPGIAAPAGPAVAGGTGVGKDWIYKVTALAEDTLEESVPSASATRANVGDPTAAAPNVVTWTAVSGAQEYNVYRQKDVPTTTTGDGVYGYIGTATGTTFNDNKSVNPDFTDTPPIPRDPFADLVSQGSWANGTTTETLSASGNYSLFSTTNNDGCIASFTVKPTTPVLIAFAVSQIQTGSPVFVVEFWDGAAWTAGTIVTAPAFTATGTTVGTYKPAGTWAIAGSGTNVPADAYNVRLRATTAPTQAIQGRMSISGAYPSTVGYFQQRKVYANTNNEPEKVWAGKSGAFKNFTISSPLQDDDAVTFTIAGRAVHEVRYLFDLGEFVILTAGGEWVAQGDANGVLVPTSPNLKQQGYNGAAEVIPVIIGNTLLYVQARGTVVRDLRFDFTSNGYTGRDLTVFAPHLFEGYTILAMDYAQVPHSIVWAVRSDGTLIGLTYLREHEIWGWHRHDTDGTFEDVCVVPEGEEDAVYVLVKRTINGVTKRYQERFASRRVSDVTVDATFMDSFLSYDGRNTGATTMTLTGGTTWAHTETLTLTASVAYFVAGDVGNAIVLTSGSDTVTLTITAYTSPTVVSVQSNKIVPASLRATALTTWTKAVDEISGLDHLEAKAVSIIGDGHVVKNGVDAPLTTVSSGAITLDRPYGVIHVGLPYTPDFELLDLEVIGTETISDKQKSVQSVTLLVEESRGLFAGIDADHLTEWKQRTAADGEGVPVQTGKVEITLGATWNNHGRVFVRQKDPLPLTILSATPHIMAGG